MIWSFSLHHLYEHCWPWLREAVLHLCLWDTHACRSPAWPAACARGEGCGRGSPTELKIAGWNCRGGQGTMFGNLVSELLSLRNWKLPTAQPRGLRNSFSQPDELQVPSQIASAPWDEWWKLFMACFQRAWTKNDTTYIVLNAWVKATQKEVKAAF